MERMAGDDVHICWKMVLEGSNFRSLARSLASNNGTLLGRGAILRNDFVNRGGFNIIDDIIACSGDEMTIGKDFDLFL